jgi:hypothetical protein
VGLNLYMVPQSSTSQLYHLHNHFPSLNTPLL